MNSTVSNASSKDLDKLPSGMISLGKQSMMYEDEVVLASSSRGPVAIPNPWFEFQIYYKGDRKHIIIYDAGCNPPGKIMFVPNYSAVAALIC